MLLEIVRNGTERGRKLRPHDHLTEIFVCRACGCENDPVAEDEPREEDSSLGTVRCRACGSEDTDWLFA